MKTTGRIWVYGLLIWIIGMAVATVLWPLHASRLLLFKSLMVVTMTAAGMFFTVRVFDSVRSDHVKTGIRTGLIWTVLNWALDLIVLVGLMKTPAATYAMDVGLGYLAIPVITVGCGILLERKR
ncbi:MAG: hypothetical protein QUS35_06470 [bacterium]|nr:hypothetical protein [bacterium]